MYVPPVAGVFGFAPLGLPEWVVCLVLGSSVLLVNEAHKWHGRRTVDR